MKEMLIFLINLYRNYLSPLKIPTCRFYPTCSAYALESIRKKGVSRGLMASLKRILKCHPLNKGGYDPVETEDRGQRTEDRGLYKELWKKE